MFGQEVNAETYATCRADMLIKGQEADNIGFGNSFDDDQHPGQRFDYLLANLWVPETRPWSLTCRDAGRC